MKNNDLNEFEKINEINDLLNEIKNNEIINQKEKSKHISEFKQFLEEKSEDNVKKFVFNKQISDLEDITPIKPTLIEKIILFFSKK